MDYSFLPKGSDGRIPAKKSLPRNYKVTLYSLLVTTNKNDYNN